ncbi:sulfotransferase family protein [Sessilibacter corallicola]|uniref:sulfotransferase family protein n=1 Tax=Sessilibacter corallicola TaxID=2904075 RepID=UPI001E50FF49|nr:sulfotransferase [Sessilibacter corallicola]MCE2026812.1 sulfotransferase [Sessilibacter corallicola]
MVKHWLNATFSEHSPSNHSPLNHSPLNDWPLNQRPNVFIIGAPRSGTSALYLSLKQHPQVSLSVLKEPHFLADDLPAQPHTITDWQDYQSLFTGSNTAVRGEGSVWYLSSEHAPRNIHALNPEAKIIVLLRRPWQQVQSLHSLYLRTGNEDVTDLEQAIELAPQRLNGQHLPDQHYFCHGLQYLNNTYYARMLARYYRYFAPEQIRVLIFDDYKQDNPKTMAQVCEFLNLSPYSDWATSQQEGQKRVRSTVMKQLKQLSPQVRQKIHPKLVQIHKTTAVSDYRPAYLNHLKSLFKAQTQELSDLLGRDLYTTWYKD